MIKISFKFFSTEINYYLDFSEIQKNILVEKMRIFEIFFISCTFFIIQYSCEILEFKYLHLKFLYDNEDYILAKIFYLSSPTYSFVVGLNKNIISRKICSHFGYNSMFGFYQRISKKSQSCYKISLFGLKLIMLFFFF